MARRRRQSRGATSKKDRTLRVSVEAGERSDSIAPAVAKKVRTPPPPRRVQAPQRRDPKRDERRAALNRDYFAMKYVLIGGAVALAIIAIVLFVVLRDENPGKKTTPTSTSAYNALPGIRKTKAPWPPEYASLADRLRPLGLSQLAQEQLAFHIHQHLDIFVDGKKESVPPSIGIDDGSFITELHTHDASGVVHVESAETKPYTLGMFMGVWGLRFSPTCIGGYCATASKPLHVYLDGKLYSGNPNDLILKNHQEIAIVYGKAPAKIPSTFDFKRYGV
jgi:hypothetical protein